MSVGSQRIVRYFTAETLRRKVFAEVFAIPLRLCAFAVKTSGHNPPNGNVIQSVDTFSKDCANRVGFASGLTTGKFLREGTPGTMPCTVSEGSFARECCVIKQMCASIAYAQALIKREDARDDTR